MRKTNEKAKVMKSRTPRKKGGERVIVCAPHTDDHVLAIGATIAQHYKRKDTVYTFIATYGELSHPHYKPAVIRKIRVKEAQRADRALGGTGRVQFLGLKELQLKAEYERKGYATTLAKRFKKLRPTKVYLPGLNDSHPDHKAFAKLVLDTIDQSKLAVDVYAYYVYPNLRHPKTPKLVVDVSESYKKKLDAIHVFRSQINVFSYAVTNNLVYVYTLGRNALEGFLHGKRFAETLYKLR